MQGWNAWGVVWGDSWGSSWGPLHEVEEYPQYYGGGGKAHKETNEERTRLFREHHDYLDTLKLRVTNDDGSTIDTEIPRNMRLPDSVAGRAMRGKVGELERPQTVADILDDPISLAMLAVLVAEATED